MRCYGRTRQTPGFIATGQVPNAAGSSNMPKMHTLVASDPFEADVLARVFSYTTVCFMGRGKYGRKDYETYPKALAGAPAHRAACGKGVLVCGVRDRGFAALITTLRSPGLKAGRLPV